MGGNLETHDNLVRYLCCHTLATVVSVGYLNAPEGKFPLQLEQAYDTLLWIMERNKGSGGRPPRIAVVGDSAGGNMAAVLCLMVRDRKGPELCLQVLLNPAPDLTCHGTLTPQGDLFDQLRWQALQYLSNPEKEIQDPHVSPLLAQDLSRLPPAVVILAEHDPLRESGQQYADQLQAAGVPTEVYCQPNVGHLAYDGGRATARALDSLQVAAHALRRAFQP